MTDLKVLVVEDEPVMRERLVDMLYNAGATKVIECIDAASAKLIPFNYCDLHPSFGKTNSKRRTGLSCSYYYRIKVFTHALLLA